MATFRLFILGRLEFDEAPVEQTLVTLAEYGTARRLCRVQIATDHVKTIAQRIRDLRAFLVVGTPAFDQLALISLGRELFDLILRGQVRNLLTEASHAGSNKRQPLELVVEDSTIAGWPWEYLYDSENITFLCREYYPISRSSFNLRQNPEPQPQSGPIRILFILGATRRDPEADIEEQLNRHKDLFRQLEIDKQATVDVIEAAHPKQIIEAVAKGDYDVFHFFGHAGYDPARREGYLRLDTNDTESHRYYANDLAADLLGLDIRLIFLNACETAVGAKDRDPSRSALAAALLDRGIPAVIATQFLMPDNSAHIFSAGIYGVLAAGKSLLHAMRTGRSIMNFGPRVTSADWGIPVLYAAYPELVIFPKPKAGIVGDPART